MNVLENMFELWNIVNNIPDNTTKTIPIGDIEVSISRNGDSFDLKIDSKKSFNDSEIKEKVNAYKEYVEELSDDLFLDILEVMKEKMDVKEFDTLIEKESYTEEEAERVENLIEHSKNIIKSVLHNKVNEYMELYEKLDS